MRDRRALERDFDHIASGLDRAFADRVGHGVRLAHANPHAALLVSNDDNGVEAKVTSTLDHLGDAGYSDDPLYKVLLVRVVVPVSVSVLLLLISVIHGHLENQTPFAGGICQRLRPTVILESAPVENDALHARPGRALCYEHPDHRRDLRL